MTDDALGEAMATWAAERGTNAVAGDSLFVTYLGANIPDPSTLKLVSAADMHSLLVRVRYETKRARNSKLRSTVLGILEEMDE